MNSENKQESEPNDTTTTTVQPSAKNVCCGIYGLRNKDNGKWYVGQSLDVYYRWDFAYRRGHCKQQRLVHAALKKYGYDTFEKVLLEKCDPVEWILDYREMYWIRYYKSFGEGYNLTEGGNRGGDRTGMKNSPEHRRKISKALMGRKYGPQSAEKRARQSARTKGRPGRIPTKADRLKMSLSHLGQCRPHTEETKRKIGEANRGRIFSEDVRKKQSESRKGSMWITDDISEKYGRFLDIPIGWHTGRLKHQSRTA